MALTILERQVGDVTILELDGRLTLGEETDRLRERLQKLLKARRPKLLLNLAKVSRIDSVGLGTMLGAIRPARAAGGDLRLLQLSRQANDVFQLLGVRSNPDLIAIFADEPAALESFASHPTHAAADTRLVES